MICEQVCNFSIAFIITDLLILKYDRLTSKAYHFDVLYEINKL